MSTQDEEWPPPDPELVAKIAAWNKAEREKAEKESRDESLRIALRIRHKRPPDPPPSPLS